MHTISSDVDKSNKEKLATVESYHKLILGPTNKGRTLNYRQ